jgi:LmbE family N-acetylglucosaminyl deacetylase
LLGLPLPDVDPLRVLAIGCHADDVEIGCGGTLLTLIARHPRVEVTWLVLSADGARGDEARASARDFLDGAAAADVRLHGFRDGFFPYLGGEVKEVFEALKHDLDPSIVFTQTEHDRHQDHRVVAELTWNTFRNHLILEYEIPKYDGDLGSPNVFVPLDPEHAQRKLELIRRHFGTQTEKHWFDDEVFTSLMRLRAVEAAGAARYAEAFYCRKLIVAP